MRVVDHEPQWWFLLEEDGALYLDGRYQNSFVEYGHPMRLNAEEAAAYSREGRSAVQRLFERVNYSAPALERSMSPYKARKEPREVAERMHAAIMAWKG